MRQESVERWYTQIVEVFARQIDELEMTSIPLYMLFVLESVERMNTVGIVDDNDLLATWEFLQKPPSFRCYQAFLNLRNVVRILKMLVVVLASVLSRDHHHVVFATALAMIYISFS